MMDKRKIYIIAGEESGDQLGGRLMAALHEMRDDLIFRGIGGNAMQQQKLDSVFLMQQLSLMGLLEIIPHLPKLIRLRNFVVRDIISWQPDMIITIDAPGFTKSVIKKIADKTNAIKIHYVAPTVWAWKEKRKYFYQQYYDCLLCLFDFEPQYFCDVGLDAHWVGHPLVEEANNHTDISLPIKSSDEKAILLLPGSRIGEINRLLPLFLDITHKLCNNKRYDYKIYLLQAAGCEDMINEILIDYNMSDEIMTIPQSQKLAMMRYCDVALAASGTVMIETAYYGLASILCYRINPITLWIVKKLIRVKYVHIINIMAQKMLIPEYIQEDCDSDKIADNIRQLCGNDDITGGDAQIKNISQYVKRLQYDDILPSSRAAMIINKFLNPK